MRDLKHDFLHKEEHKQVQILLHNKCVNFLTQKIKIIIIKDFIYFLAKQGFIYYMVDVASIT